MFPKWVPRQKPFYQVLQKVLRNHTNKLFKTAIIYNDFLFRDSKLAAKNMLMSQIQILLILILGLSISSCSVNHIYDWRSTNQPGKNTAHFARFTGKETFRFKGEKGGSLDFNVTTHLTGGELQITLREHGETLLEERFQNNDQRNYTIPLKKASKYKVKVSGIQASGSYDIRYQTRARSSSRSLKEVNMGFNRNVETYFIAERLVAENIGSFVFSNKSFDYTSQPIVTAAFQKFKSWKDSSSIKRMSDLIKELKPILRSNAPIINLLLQKKDFPETGDEYGVIDFTAIDHKYHKYIPLIQEVLSHLQEFYVKAHVGDFLNENTGFYIGAVKEIEKDINKDTYPFMEEYFGEDFLYYNLLVSPAMPIFAEEGGFHGFGPTVNTPKGKVAFMIMSSSVMLPQEKRLSDYKAFAFNNIAVTQLLGVHEIAHSFVNPHLQLLQDTIKRYDKWFTPALKSIMEKQSYGNWNICIAEHLVRLAEIRLAEKMGDSQRASRLRKMHIDEYHFVFLPEFEAKIKEYEQNRTGYKTFKGFIPELLTALDTITTREVDKRLSKVQ